MFFFFVSMFVETEGVLLQATPEWSARLRATIAELVTDIKGEALSRRDSSIYTGSAGRSKQRKEEKLKVPPWPKKSLQRRFSCSTGTLFHHLIPCDIDIGWTRPHRFFIDYNLKNLDFIPWSNLEIVLAGRYLALGRFLASLLKFGSCRRFSLFTIEEGESGSAKVFTVILHIFGVVFFSVFSVVNGFTEIKMERSWQHRRAPKSKRNRTLHDCSPPKF